jgi:hypothetical protein
MSPKLAYSFLNTNLVGESAKGIKFHDPLCGSGTTALVARSLGFSVSASDAMYPAAIITKAKLRLLSKSALNELVEFGATLRVSNGSKPRNPWARYKVWYTSRVLRCLEEIAQEIFNMRGASCFSHLLTAFFQTSWDVSSADNNVIVPTRSNYSRAAPRLQPDRIIDIFQQRLERVATAQRALSDLGFDLKSPKVSQSDALDEKAWPDDKVDVIFTSPPYGCGIDYQRAFRLQMRIWNFFEGGQQTPDLIGRRNHINSSEESLPHGGLRSRWYRRLSNADDERKVMFLQYLSDIRTFLRLSRKKLSKRGRLCMVVGNPEIGKARVPLVHIIQKLASEENLRLEAQPSYDRIKSRIQNFRLRSATSPIDREYLLSFLPK